MRSIGRLLSHGERTRVVAAPNLPRPPARDIRDLWNLEDAPRLHVLVGLRAGESGGGNYTEHCETSLESLDYCWILSRVPGVR